MTLLERTFAQQTEDDALGLGGDDSWSSFSSDFSVSDDSSGDGHSEEWRQAMAKKLQQAWAGLPAHLRR